MSFFSSIEFHRDSSSLFNLVSIILIFPRKRDREISPMQWRRLFPFYPSRSRSLFLFTFSKRLEKSDCFIIEFAWEAFEIYRLMFKCEKQDEMILLRKFSSDIQMNSYSKVCHWYRSKWFLWMNHNRWLSLMWNLC
jgi:hypothetical protein